MTNNHTWPKGKQGRMDARLYFVAQCLNKKITDNVNLANDWFINEKGDKMTTEQAISKFKEWLQ